MSQALPRAQTNNSLPLPLGPSWPLLRTASHSFNPSSLSRLVVFLLLFPPAHYPGPIVGRSYSHPIQPAFIFDSHTVLPPYFFRASSLPVRAVGKDQTKCLIALCSSPYFTPYPGLEHLLEALLRDFRRPSTVLEQFDFRCLYVWHAKSASKRLLSFAAQAPPQRA